MKLDGIRMLLDYHYWARNRVLDALESLTHEQFTRDMGNSFRSVRDTIVHVYGADLVWYERWQGRAPSSLVDPSAFHDVPAVRQPWLELERKYRAYVEEVGESGLGRSFDYRLFNGQPSTSVIWHTLQHVVNHGSYHRGQLTTMLRQLGGAAPKPMDLIAYYRERQAAASMGR
jgi:uncharacterized damage-inducible protein DinB